MMKCGIALRGVGATTLTSRRLRSVFFKNNNDRIPYFEIRYSLFEICYSLFQVFVFDLTGPFLAGGWAET